MTRIFYRSSVTGMFVTKAYALRHPHLTVRETQRKRKVVRPLYKKAKR